MVFSLHTYISATNFNCILFWFFLKIHGMVYRYSELKIGKGKMEAGGMGTKASLHKEISFQKHFM